jgi:tetratricopeptide (TPR) repeat protein
MALQPGPVRAPENRFVGRRDELTRVREALASLSTRLVALSGPRGIGKTRLAYEIFAYYRDHGFDFKDVISISAHGLSAEALADELARRISAVSRGAETGDALLRRLVSMLEGHRILVFMDNVDEGVAESDQFGSLISQWVEANHDSVLLITSRPRLQRSWCDSRQCLNIDLQGIRAREAILSLVGNELRQRFGDEALLEYAQSVGFVPQRLVRLRGVSPTSLEELNRAAQEGAQAADTAALTAALSAVGHIEHVLAIGEGRRLDVSKGFLRFLWQRLVKESTADLDRVTDALVARDVMRRGISANSDYRIHPDIHVELRHLSEARGPQWRSKIHRTLRDYYQELLEADSFDLQASDELMYHSAALGDFDGAFKCVMQDSKLDVWHSRGLAMALEAPVRRLAELSDEDRAIFSPVQMAAIAIELARIGGDLSNPEMCLQHLDKALRELDGMQPNAEADMLRRSAWRHMAITHANLGNNQECVTYYQKVVRDDENVTDAWTALAMGYMGYEYCDYMRFELANRWTELALIACPSGRDPKVYAKNLCNRGLVLFYQGRIKEARQHFLEALSWVGAVGGVASDVREHGRALIHLGMAGLADPSPAADVDDSLRTGTKLSAKAGDLRRVALGKAWLGVMDSRIGTRALSTAAELLTQAITELIRLRDRRNAAFQLLNLCMVYHQALVNEEPGSVDEIWFVASEDNFPRDMRQAADRLRRESESRYLVDFWFACQRRLFFPERPTMSAQKRTR